MNRAERRANKPRGRVDAPHAVIRVLGDPCIAGRVHRDIDGLVEVGARWHRGQFTIAQERTDLHAISRYFFLSGYGEGWALYTERLADEMGLYGSDLDRLGMLSNEAWRAARMVVDSGIHGLGWSRQQALDYMDAHNANSHELNAAEVDRYIAVPGQATSYMLGALEIRRLREQAEAALGDHFDIRAFHDVLLTIGVYCISNGTSGREFNATVVAAVLTIIQAWPNVAEFVFPSMFHLFAEAGMVPAPKVCKESFNPQMMATAMGAALPLAMSDCATFWASAGMMMSASSRVRSTSVRMVCSSCSAVAFAAS